MKKICVIHLDMYLTSYSTLLSGIISVFDIESSVSSAQCSVGGTLLAERLIQINIKGLSL